MGNARLKLAQAAQDALCSVTNDIRNANEIYKATFDILENSPLNTPLLGSIYPILNCDRPIPPPSLPPFTGGQCFTTYDVSTTATLHVNVPPSDDTSTRTDRFTGQINGISEKPNTSGGKDIILTYTRPDGVQQEFSLYGYSGSGASFTNYGITGIVRVDGLPDNCGDPPVLPVPKPDPGFNVRNPTIDWDDNSGGTTTISPTLTVGNAYITVNAQVIVPVKIAFNTEVSLTANINISTGGVTFSPGKESNKKRSDDGCDYNGDDDLTPDDELPPSDDDPSDPKQPKDPEATIVGCVVTVTNNPSGKYTEIVQDGNPNIYAPALGYVNFLISLGVNKPSGWTQDIYVKNKRQFIPCPWSGGAIAVEGTPQPGVVWTITPVRKVLKDPVVFV